MKRDSLLHLETSALIVVILSAFLPEWIAGLLALAIGFGKEIWDKHHGGVPSWRDVAFDFAGVLIGITISVL